MTKPPIWESPKTDVSPSSGYLLYGRGSREDFDREVNRVKTELRAELYGSDEQNEKKRPKVKSAAPAQMGKRTNGSAVVTLIVTIIAIIVIAAFAILTSMGQDLGQDYVTVVKSFVEGLTEIQIDLSFGTGVCAIVAALFLVTTFIGAACSVKRARLGKLMLTGSILWMAAALTMTILLGVQTSALPLQMVILTVLSVIALITIAVGGKKTGGK